MATLYLIRHGQASFGAADYDKLSPLGERQAGVLGGYLRDHGISIDAAYCGELSRQKRTAEIALGAQAQDVPLTVDPRFDEVRNDEHLEHLLPALMEEDAALKALVERGLTTSRDYQKALRAVFTHWVSPECDVPQIQSWDEYSAGVAAALEAVTAAHGSGSTVAVFTSGGTIATAVAFMLGLPGSHAYAFYEPLLNASITKAFYSKGKISLSSFNEHAFLDVLGRRGEESLLTYR
ncbi:histidine phosphatase family protein [Parvularcula oceani]|uniref:histidine phosphatase family protein n=1 Tax=Parvularcula oceani TaxID=1247963 RepID=UPI0004E2138A|nr:histidine phosphatase family protein [Parvularcula oceani]